MRSSRHKIPQINSSSSADIAFLLLIFFLITTSTDTGKGIYKQLPPPISVEAVKKRIDINEKNLLTFTIEADNEVLCGEDPIRISEVKEYAEIFIRELSSPDEHVIALKYSRDCDFQTYLSVQNELIAAYNELRKSQTDLPARISESELPEEGRTDHE